MVSNVHRSADDRVDYNDIHSLDLMPRSPKKKFNALSLFSGAGGMDIGLVQAGFEILACVEFDPHAAETLRAAVGRERRTTRVIEGDVREIDPKDLMRDMGLKAGELDLLCGGPPCQAFSQIGKQEALKDERGLLLFEMVRFARVFRPRAILIEQVKGLLSATHESGHRGEVLEMLLRDLEKLDYVPKWSVVNAADYGVPQLRKRVFIVTTKKPNGFVFPAPTHVPQEETGSLFGLPPFRTVGEVLSGLKPPTKKTEQANDVCHVDVTPAGDRYRIHGVPEGSFLAGQHHLPK